MELVSLDLFQTLVNIDSRREQVWKPILQGDYAPSLAETCAGALRGHFFDQWAVSQTSGAFISLQEVYGRSFAAYFAETGRSFDAEEAVDILFREHRAAPFYEETAEFLGKLMNTRKMCIVSDADEAMIPDFCAAYGIKLFTSEEHRSYKNDDRNRMFKEVIRYYGVQPSEILHIGDSVSDVLGARREGIRTCWINRTGSVWTQEAEPDFTVTSLLELEGLLQTAEAGRS